MNLILFWLIRISTKIGRKTLSMRVALVAKNCRYLLVDSSINQLFRFISFHLFFIALQEKKIIVILFFNARLFRTFNAAMIHMIHIIILVCPLCLL